MHSYSESRSGVNAVFIIKRYFFIYIFERKNNIFYSILAFLTSLSKGISINRFYFQSTSMILIPSIAFVPKNNTHSFVPQPVTNLKTTNKFRSLFKMLTYKSDPTAQVCNTNPHSIRSIAASTLEAFR